MVKRDVSVVSGTASPLPSPGGGGIPRISSLREMRFGSIGGGSGSPTGGGIFSSDHKDKMSRRKSTSSLLSDIVRHPDVREEKLRRLAAQQRDHESLMALADFLRNKPPPKTNFMSIPEDASSDSDGQIWSQLNVFRKKGSKKRKGPRRQPMQIRLPDSAVAGTTIGGYRHIAISIPIEYAHLSPTPSPPLSAVGSNRTPEPRLLDPRRVSGRTFTDRGVVTVLKPVVEDLEYLPPSEHLDANPVGGGPHGTTPASPLSPPLSPEPRDSAGRRHDNGKGPASPLQSPQFTSPALARLDAVRRARDAALAETRMLHPALPSPQGLVNVPKRPSNAGQPGHSYHLSTESASSSAGPSSPPPLSPGSEPKIGFPPSHRSSARPLTAIEPVIGSIDKVTQGLHSRTMSETGAGQQQQQQQRQQSTSISGSTPIDETELIAEKSKTAVDKAEPVVDKAELAAMASPVTTTTQQPGSGPSTTATRHDEPESPVGGEFANSSVQSTPKALLRKKSRQETVRERKRRDMDMALRAHSERRKGSVSEAAGAAGGESSSSSSGMHLADSPVLRRSREGLDAGTTPTSEASSPAPKQRRRVSVHLTPVMVVADVKPSSPVLGSTDVAGGSSPKQPARADDKLPPPTTPTGRSLAAGVARTPSPKRLHASSSLTALTLGLGFNGPSTGADSSLTGLQHSSHYTTTTSGPTPPQSVRSVSPPPSATAADTMQRGAETTTAADGGLRSPASTVSVPLDRTSLARRREWAAMREQQTAAPWKRSRPAAPPKIPVASAKSRGKMAAMSSEHAAALAVHGQSASLSRRELARRYEMTRDAQARELERRVRRLERSSDLWLRAVVPLLERLEGTVDRVNDRVEWWEQREMERERRDGDNGQPKDRLPFVVTTEGTRRQSSRAWASAPASRSGDADTSQAPAAADAPPPLPSSSRRKGPATAARSDDANSDDAGFDGDEDVHTASRPPVPRSRIWEERYNRQLRAQERERAVEAAVQRAVARRLAELETTHRQHRGSKDRSSRRKSGGANLDTGATVSAAEPSGQAQKPTGLGGGTASGHEGDDDEPRFKN